MSEANVWQPRTNCKLVASTAIVSYTLTKANNNMWMDLLPEEDAEEGITITLPAQGTLDLGSAFVHIVSNYSELPATIVGEEGVTIVTPAGLDASIAQYTTVVIKKSDAVPNTYILCEYSTGSGGGGGGEPVYWNDIVGTVSESESLVAYITERLGNIEVVPVSTGAVNLLPEHAGKLLLGTNAEGLITYALHGDIEVTPHEWEVGTVIYGVSLLGDSSFQLAPVGGNLGVISVPPYKLAKCRKLALWKMVYVSSNNWVVTADLYNDNIVRLAVPTALLGPEHNGAFISCEAAEETSLVIPNQADANWLDGTEIQGVGVGFNVSLVGSVGTTITIRIPSGRVAESYADAPWALKRLEEDVWLLTGYLVEV